MRDVPRWLAGAARSLAVDVAGRERRRAARRRARSLLATLLALGSAVAVAIVLAGVAAIAVGVVLTYQVNLVVTALGWALLISGLALAPLLALRTGASVHAWLV